MQLVEGYFIESVEGIVFDVKGLVHPPGKVVAFPRFISDLKGMRSRGSCKYTKVYSLADRFKFLEGNCPSYVVYDKVFGEKLCEVPYEKIKKVYSPIKRLKRLRAGSNLDLVENAALRCLKVLKETANLPWSKLGVSGSLLVNMHTSDSDIDIVVYGCKNCKRAYYALQGLLENSEALFKPYDEEDLKSLFEFRSKDTTMRFDDFVAVESRKVLQGKFMNRDYFIRFVKDFDEADEQYGDVRYTNCGYAKIEATIVDDSESIFTPNTYKIENVRIIEGSDLKPIKEITSFRGRFCEQAQMGETVIAQGKVEHVKNFKKSQDFFRLLLGGKPSDYMILKKP